MTLQPQSPDLSVSVSFKNKKGTEQKTLETCQSCDMKRAEAPERSAK